MTLRKRIYNYFKGCREWGKWEAKGPFKREIERVNAFFIKGSLKRWYFSCNWNSCLSKSFRYLTPNRRELLQRLLLEVTIWGQCVFVGLVSVCGLGCLKLEPQPARLDPNCCEGGVLPVVTWRWQHWATYVVFLSTCAAWSILQRCSSSVWISDCHSDFFLLNDCMYVNDSAFLL